MSNTPAYLPQSRDYFRKFKFSHVEEYKDMQKSWAIRRDLDIPVTIITSGSRIPISVVNNLDETFRDVSIPEDFSSPKALITK